MEFFGYLLAIIIGFFLGIFGGGGSLLAVPVFAYIFTLDEKAATAYSLFTVGIGSLIGAIKQQKNIDFRIAIIFGIPSIIGVWIIRFFIVPTLPDTIFKIDDFILTRRMLMFGVFSLMLFFSAFSMIYDSNKNIEPKKINNLYSLIILEGLIVGGLTGLVGAGGGFLIIPALVIFIGLDIKKAIATSLLIISLKSTFGFLFGDMLVMNIDWEFLLSFTFLTILGILLGSYVGIYIKKSNLKKWFGIFILTVAIFVFIKEFINN